MSEQLLNKLLFCFVLTEDLNITVDIDDDINGDISAEKTLDATHSNSSERLHTPSCS